MRSLIALSIIVINSIVSIPQYGLRGRDIPPVEHVPARKKSQIFQVMAKRKRSH